MKQPKILLALVLVLAFLLSACTGTGTPGATSADSGAAPEGAGTAAPSGGTEPAADAPTAGSDVKVAMVFSTLGDQNFNDWGWDGVKMAEEKLGITFDYVECPTVTEAETQINMFAMDGIYDLVIVLGSDRKDILESAAKEYPEQKFVMIDSSIDDTIPNASGARANFPEWQFLSGVLAGLVTKDARMPMANSENIIGFAGGMDSPVSRAGAAGFLSGAKYVNPDVEILYTIVGSYTDPNRAYEIAMTTYGRGADVMSVNCGSSANGVMNAAEENERYFMSTSPALISPTNSLGVSITRFDLLVYREIEAMVNGTWTPGNRVTGIAEGTCDISFDGCNVEVSQDMLDTIEDVKKKIVNGEIKFVNDPDDIEEWSKTYRYKAAD